MIQTAMWVLRRMMILVALLTLVSATPQCLRADCHPKRVAPSAIPAYAWDTMDYIRSHRSAPPGFQGGRYFGNYASKGATKLPTESGGRRITYQEWDVHRKKNRLSRGAERIVTGSDHRAWYTADHYCTFTEMK